MKKHAYMILLVQFLLLTACAKKEVKEEEPAGQAPKLTQTEQEEETTTGEDTAVAEDTPTPVDIPAVTEGVAEEENTDNVEEVQTLDGIYRDILLKYKEAQDSGYSRDQLEAMGFYTGLTGYGWPENASDAYGYQYLDVDSDGTEELLITYQDEIVDIYGFDGSKARLALISESDESASLYPDGMIKNVNSTDDAYSDTKWYQYDSALGDYFPIIEKNHESGREDLFYIFCYFGLTEKEHEEIEKNYREYGDYPVWIGEWADMITKEEYEELIPHTDPIELPKSNKLSDIK